MTAAGMIADAGIRRSSTGFFEAAQTGSTHAATAKSQITAPMNVRDTAAVPDIMRSAAALPFPGLSSSTRTVRIRTGRRTEANAACPVHPCEYSMPDGV